MDLEDCLLGYSEWLADREQVVRTLEKMGQSNNFFISADGWQLYFAVVSLLGMVSDGNLTVWVSIKKMVSAIIVDEREKK